MIDTDKYEGHTPAPWKASHDVLEYGHIVNNNGWRVYVGEHEKRAVIENRTFMHDDLSEANAQLIADSPLLLAEVKRWKGNWTFLRDWSVKNINNEKTNPTARMFSEFFLQLMDGIDEIDVVSE